MSGLKEGYEPGMEQAGLVSMAIDSGERRLNELGYKQELNRNLAGIINFTFGFSTISVLMGLTGLYGYGFSYGGPVAIMWGWVVVGFFTCLVAASLAEICSGYPTAGGLYYWSFELAGPKYGPLAAWLTAWLNLVGLLCGTTSVSMICAQLLSQMVLLSTGTALNGGWIPSNGDTVAIFAGVLFLAALINIAGVGPLAIMEYISLVWHIVGTFLIIILLPIIAPKTQSADFVFTTWIPDSSGVNGSFYTFLVGLLMAQFTLAGYDACAHVSEETKSADKNAGWGLFLAVFISFWIGLFYLISLTFSIQDPNTITSFTNETGGYAGVQIFYDAFHGRYNCPTGAVLMTAIPMVASFFSAGSTLTAATRVMYAMNRDKAFPVIWRALRYVQPVLKTPVFSIALSVLVCFGLGCSFFGGQIVFNAVISVSVIGFYAAYTVPIFLRLTIGRKVFVRGPFHMGMFSDVVMTAAILWNLFIIAVMVLPTAYPINTSTLNYAPITFGGVLAVAVGGWFLGARTYFKGPEKTFGVDPSIKAGQAF